jgi:oligosaccharyltransferase complex subunit beta
VDNGGNLLVAGGPDVSSALRGLAHNFGVDYDAPKGRVVDHLSHHASDAGKHTRVLSNAYFPSRYVVGAGLAEPKNGRAPPSVVYEGVALTVAPDNILAVRTLSLSLTGYSALLSAPIGSYPLAAGKEALLVASVQARNNARATFTGSLWFLSDEAWELGPELANARLARAVARWTFQRSGVLTASNLRHAHADGSPPEHQVEHTEQRDLPVSMFPEPEIARQSLVYRIKDNVTFAVDLRVSDENGVVVPYVADDMQLEFVMLDPYIRTGLPHDGRGKFAVTFTVPDVYGIFHFRVAYRRPGVSALLLREQVSVRPFRHNEYERFISSAYPYYTAAFAMMAGVFIYAAFFLYSPAGAPVVAAAKAAAGAASGAGQASAAGTGAGDSKKQK